jgi:hypothetical protein
MRWEDERWVKVYTRDTTDWLALSFDAQALFLMLLRKVDRAGLLPLGKHGKRGVAVIVGHASAWERLAPAVEELLSDGCVVIADGVLRVPNFVAAQEARASDKARQAKARETTSVTKRDEPSQNVTESHAASHDVTGGHAASHDVTPRVDKSRLEQSREDLFPEAAVASPAPAKKAKKEPTGDPRHAPLVKALVEACGYPFRSGRDAKAVSELLALADQQPATRGETAGLEVIRRARIGWAWEGFPSCRSLTELAEHWGRYDKPQSGVEPTPQKPRKLVEM